ncbi:BON domain-containing protein [Legionella londiniensis]|uniref:Putative periplasmic or secreted lipoprotein n=1 Tax=Legionella londiniensis TaxID=45068 RepID=A0A0W0VI61_9GAMM|nr:BON domain-containing protein [Legionella londiniensis]KTD19549.1 putative periplasmic or secreted lipoprotein [Legionella londiniensis]STX92230.1 lipoproteins [Legionella londiniensis]
MKNKTSILIIALSLLLSSCVALVAAGAAGGLIVYDKRSVPMIERDARIFYVLRKAIVANPKFYDSHIVISSFNQIVLLAGQTPSASLRVLAEKIAKETPNVERVYNEITIGRPVSLTQRSQDSWITGQVRAQMIAKKGLESGSIRVVTENNVVYLIGIATKEQANLAVDVARKVPEVQKVVKIFRYIT